MYLNDIYFFILLYYTIFLCFKLGKMKNKKIFVDIDNNYGNIYLDNKYIN